MDQFYTWQHEVSKCIIVCDTDSMPLPMRFLAPDYDLGRYNQSLAEGYFSDLPARIWNGLVNTISSYDNPSSGSIHGPVEMQISALFRGKNIAEATEIARDVENREAQAEVARLKKRLEEVERELGERQALSPAVAN